MIKENDVVLCTVISIEGATIFLEFENGTKGTMTLSEVAAGRIRNLREYVHPKKKIVCKVLKIIDNHPQFSLRRVTAREREEVMTQHKKEQAFYLLLKTIVKTPEHIIQNIKKEYDLTNFLEKIKEDASLLEKFLKKQEAQQLSKVLAEKKEKEKEVKKIFILKSFSESGVDDIKKILEINDINIRYLGSSQFRISTTGKNFKEAEHKVSSALTEIESRAKEKKAIFELKEK